MDNKSDDTITFDKDGYCNYCSDVLRRILSTGEGRKLAQMLSDAMK